jgi:prepilin-type processing-associated H-X9-DG protein
MKRFIFSSIGMCCAIPIVIGILLAAGIGIYFEWISYVRRPQDYAYNCQSNLRQISLAMFMYNQDYDDKLPRAIFHDKTAGWVNSLQPYIRSYTLFQCPAEENPLQKFPQPDKSGFTDYWLNSNLSGINPNHIQHREQIIFLGDGDGGSSASTASYSIDQLPESWRTSATSPAKRHKGGANYAFADGHVKWLKPAQVSQLPTSKKHPVYTFSVK